MRPGFFVDHMPELGAFEPTRLRLRAPAKVNFSLEVRGKRPDGYHELRMLVAPVSLFDLITLERLPEPGRVSVRCIGDPAVRGGRTNLCHTAAGYYLGETGAQAGIRVRVRKRIPSGAGLGGGSSDAAVTLLGLERLFGLPLSSEARRRAAFEIGADVPFFLTRSAAWVEGIGERVRPCPLLGPVWLVILYPGVILSTGQVFARWNTGLTTQGGAPTIRNFTIQGIVEGLRNDLQAAAVAIEPRIEEGLAALGRAGAPDRLMSGSGSAVFGLFPDESAARRAAVSISADPGAAGWRIEVARTLSPGEFPFPNGL